MSTTTLLERPAEMSEAERSFDITREVKTMTATTTIGLRSTRRARPHGLDLVVMRLSLAMLLWARRHANRATFTHDEQAQRLLVERETVRREHETTRLTARVF